VTHRVLRFAELARAVREELGQEQRYAHVVRVARLAERLAMRHGESTEKARVAGLLHDLARLYPPARLIEECERREMPIAGFERANPIVLHARLGAELARERFGVEDPAILSAIRAHTVPAPRMSRLDEILHIADGVEPGRSYPERAAIENLAFQELDAAMLRVILATVAYLRSVGAEIAPPTFAALAVYQRRAAEPLTFPTVPERSPACPT
jgi:predicted HD superfamily hydrolase involved in NAD metabolism